MAKEIYQAIGRRICIYLLLLLTACKAGGSREEAQAAHRVCGSCHLFPDPSLLPAACWDKQVLPQMALRMGVMSGWNGGPLSAEQEKLRPLQPLISEAEWKAIRHYYLSQAPAKLQSDVIPEPVANIGVLFEIRHVRLPGERAANISCIRINPVQRELYAADAVNHLCWYVNAEGIATHARRTGDAVITDMQVSGRQVLETVIGTSLNLTTAKNGAVQYRQLYDDKPGTTVLQQLYRPVQTLSADLDADGIPELLTAEFGVDEGKLSIHAKANRNGYTENVIYALPGTVHMAVTDMNRDGRPDILALSSQGNELLQWFENLGKLEFTPHTLLRFPPVYGSSGFDTADMDDDGLTDIIYTCGDNADFSPVMKPWHGIYIYHNNGNGTYTQQVFLPQNGAYKALARDFNNDGQTDIACISYFPDTTASPQDEFRLYIKTGSAYQLYSNHLGNVGRWLVMDAADIDGDGDCDIALGSYPMMMTSPGGYRAQWQQGPGVVLLINKMCGN
ncbi:FG-GAP repeat domain-containing protein [Chitinophaga solisilvae]|uniref:FG-GAP repeat domain-containing protein n=1 Tax=Chitinophaga solisilvae TaxID=1233460 RepID=UPI00136D5017|nr:VCBS repeat-containing protein [Chitinophaga solisilvae]